jgi:hypothetical protein
MAERGTPAGAVGRPSGQDLWDRYPELRPFVGRMLHELWANRSKGDQDGWRAPRCTRERLMLDVYHHVAKLARAIRDDDRRGIEEYSADVANLAFIVWDHVDNGG